MSKRKVPSRLLDALFKEASTTRNRVSWARAVCRAASHQARSGEVDESLVSIAAVRKEFGPELHPEVACWLMLAEGILHWYRFEPRAAYERMIRAQALSAAIKSQRVAPSCSAWLALVEFNTGHFEKMAKHLDDAFTLALPTDHHARARAALVLADAYQVAGDYPSAKPWYEQVRRHVTSEGDETSLGAMLFNVAAFRLANIRLADAFGERMESEIHRMSMEASGSVSFDYMTGNSSQEPLRFLLRAQQLAIEGKYKDALSILEKLDFQLIDGGRMQALVSIDRAWCLLNLENIADAVVHSKEAEKQLELVSDLDDRAYILARQSKIANASGEDALAEALQASALNTLRDHQTFQENLKEVLAKIRAVPMK